MLELSGLITGTLTNVFGDAITRVWSDKREGLKLKQALDAAIALAEQRLLYEYGQEDAEIARAIVQNTRFVDLPSVNTTLKDLLQRLLQNPIQATQVIRQSFEGIVA